MWPIPVIVLAVLSLALILAMVAVVLVYFPGSSLLLSLLNVAVFALAAAVFCTPTKRIPWLSAIPLLAYLLLFFLTNSGNLSAQIILSALFLLALGVLYLVHTLIRPGRLALAVAVLCSAAVAALLDLSAILSLRFLIVEFYDGAFIFLQLLFNILAGICLYAVYAVAGFSLVQRRAVSAAPAYSAASRAELVCPRCGARFPADRRFCEKCGAPLAQPVPPGGFRGVPPVVR